MKRTHKKTDRKTENARVRVFEDTPRLEVASIRWCAQLPQRRRGGRGYTAKRNLAVTHARIELFIVMAACSTTSSLCVGVKRGETGKLEGLRFGWTFFPFPLPLNRAPPFLHSLHYSPCPRAYTPCRAFGIYKYRYQSLSLSRCYNTATRARIIRSSYSLPFSHPYVVLCQGPSGAYAIRPPTP